VRIARPASYLPVSSMRYGAAWSGKPDMLSSIQNPTTLWISSRTLGW
jgi:hypothetical protein